MSRPSRRTVLLGALAVPLAACTDAPAPPPPPPVDPDVALRAAAIARERSLLAAYDAVLAAAPRDAARLTALRAEHVTHLATLGEPLPGASAAAASGAATSPAGSPAAASPVRTLTQLAAAERAAGTAHLAALPTASRELAAVLATLAASEASHPVALS